MIFLFALFMEDSQHNFEAFLLTFIEIVAQKGPTVVNVANLAKAGISCLVKEI